MNEILMCNVILKCTRSPMVTRTALSESAVHLEKTR